MSPASTDNIVIIIFVIITEHQPDLSLRDSFMRQPQTLISKDFCKCGDLSPQDSGCASASSPAFTFSAGSSFPLQFSQKKKSTKSHKAFWKFPKVIKISKIKLPGHETQHHSICTSCVTSGELLDCSMTHLLICKMVIIIVSLSLGCYYNYMSLYKGRAQHSAW